MPRPLLIFDLEGTLADVFPANARRPQSELLLRPRMVGGLKQLRADPAGYAIALATKAGPEQVKLFLSYVQQCGFEFDSVHERDIILAGLPMGSPIDYDSWGQRFKDLSTVYVRHEISIESISSQVLVIEDIQLAPNNIFVGERTHTDSEGFHVSCKRPEDLLFSGSRCNVSGNPVPVGGKVPSVLLVPNLFLGPKFQTVSMDVVVDLIRMNYAAGGGDFERGYHCLDSEEIIKYESNALQMQEYSEQRASLALHNRSIQELCKPFTHRYLIVKGDSHPLEACERITL